MSELLNLKCRSTCTTTELAQAQVVVACCWTELDTSGRVNVSGTKLSLGKRVDTQLDRAIVVGCTTTMAVFTPVFASREKDLPPLFSGNGLVHRYDRHSHIFSVLLFWRYSGGFWRFLAVFGLVLGGFCHF